DAQDRGGAGDRGADPKVCGAGELGQGAARRGVGDRLQAGRGKLLTAEVADHRAQVERGLVGDQDGDLLAHVAESGELHTASWQGWLVGAGASSRHRSRHRMYRSTRYPSRAAKGNEGSGCGRKVG